MPVLGSVHVPTWSYGSAVPTGGYDGDFYLRTTNDDLYQKLAGTWTVVANLKGSTGATGSQGVQGVVGPLIASFSVGGLLIATTYSFRWYPPASCTISGVRASVGTAPTGSSVIVDVNKNGTTIYTTQGNRPTIAAAGNTALGGTPDVTALTTSDYLSFDVDAIGSTTPGSNLTIQVYAN